MIDISRSEFPEGDCLVLFLHHWANTKALVIEEGMRMLLNFSKKTKNVMSLESLQNNWARNACALHLKNYWKFRWNWFKYDYKNPFTFHFSSADQAQTILITPLNKMRNPFTTLLKVMFNNCNLKIISLTSKWKRKEKKK